MTCSPLLGLVTRPAMLSRPTRPAPLTRPPVAPIDWAIDLPLTQGPMTSRPSVSLPAMEAVRPTLSDHSISVTPAHSITKRKSVIKDVGATKRQKTKGGKAVLVRSSILPLEEEENIGPLTEAIQEFKKEIHSFVNPLPVPFLVVQGAVGGDIGLALEALGKYVEVQFKEMQSRTLKLAETIGAKIAAMAAQPLESEPKAKKKLARADRTADDERAYTHIKVHTFYCT